MREKIISFFSLFGSSATLLCCALPATLSIIVGGTAVGALLSTFPWLIPLSRHKGWIFVVAGILLMINGIFSTANFQFSLCSQTISPSIRMSKLVGTENVVLTTMLFFVSSTTIGSVLLSCVRRSRSISKNSYEIYSSGEASEWFNTKASNSFPSESIALPTTRLP